MGSRGMRRLMYLLVEFWERERNEQKNARSHTPRRKNQFRRVEDPLLRGRTPSEV